MTSIVVRNLEPMVKEALAARAAEHGRSMEAEAREILGRAVLRPRHRNISEAFRDAASEVGGVEELSVPERTDPARAVEFE